MGKELYIYKKNINKLEYWMKKHNFDTYNEAIGWLESVVTNITIELGDIPKEYGD